jgi:hypothetical protein
VPSAAVKEGGIRIKLKRLVSQPKKALVHVVA